MKKNKRKKIIIPVILLFIIIVMLNEKNILKYFIDQASNPSGPIGYVMTKIWNSTFDAMSKWGINNITLSKTDILLDVGCGGGQTIYTLATNDSVKKFMELTYH